MVNEGTSRYFVETSADICSESSSEREVVDMLSEVAGDPEEEELPPLVFPTIRPALIDTVTPTKAQAEKAQALEKPVSSICPLVHRSSN